MKLFVATHNAHKLREIAQILPDFEIEADDPAGVEETAPDFLGNAFIKVRAIAARHPGAWCMADDSGLEVNALNGAPGVKSARYAGEPTDTAKNNALLLKNLAGRTDRAANFTCAVALVSPEGHELSAVGQCFGTIAEQPAGVEGFGYDPLFIPEGHTKSFAELSADEKNAISHRGRALEKVKMLLSPKKFNLMAWLSLFRIVNLPTVPGDVLVGCAGVIAFVGGTLGVRQALGACLASCFLYLFGLVDNDLVGTKTDTNRPIPDGLISIPVARSVRMGLCVLAAAMGPLCKLPPLWALLALTLMSTIILYNRTKWALLMGLCRGLNVLCGVAIVLGSVWDARLLIAPLVWSAYITAVTLYAKDEAAQPQKRAFVGFLIGALIYLQLGALVGFYLFTPTVVLRNLLLIGAALLILLRLSKRAFPKVSGS